MAAPKYLDKTKVLTDLRTRGLDDRADWVDRTMPDLIDASRNASLLQMLGIDLDAAAAADLAPAQ